MKKKLLFIFLFHIFISQFFLPQILLKKNFLVFSTWSIFSTPQTTETYDILLAPQNEYFFKSNRNKNLSSLQRTLFYQVASSKGLKVQTDLIMKLKTETFAKSTYLVKYSAPYSDVFLNLKKINPEIIMELK